MDKRKKQVFFGIMLIILLASIPLFCGYIGDGEKLAYYLQCIEGIRDSILDGRLPILIRPFQGAGYSDTVFCCNILLYVPAILRVLGFTVVTSYSIYCIIINALTAWTAWYCFGKIFRSDSVGLACSALYTLSIPRIYQFVVAGAAGEGSALTFLPVVIYGLYRILMEETQEKREWAALAIGYAGLLQTHLLTFEITFFLSILICLVCIRRLFYLTAFIRLIKGIFAAIGLSMWYLVPLVDSYRNSSYISIGAIQKNGLFITQLLYQFWGLASKGINGDSGMLAAQPEGVGFVLFFVLAIFGMIWFQGKLQNLAEGHVLLAKISAVLGFLLLCLTLCNFPWDRIQKINNVTRVMIGGLQSPDRFLGWAAALLVVVFGFVLWYFRERRIFLYWGGIGLVVINVLIGPVSLMEELITRGNSNYFQPEEWMRPGNTGGLLCMSDGQWYWLLGLIITIGTVLAICIAWWGRCRKRA